MLEMREIDNNLNTAVSILVYTFPRCGTEDAAFAKIVASIERTWTLVGKLKTIIVSSHRFQAVDDFAANHSNVKVQIESALVPGDIRTMSVDCIKRLHTRFDTPYVLIIQDDGFPVKSNLADFVGKYDFIGAPILSDGCIRKLAYALRMGSFNGGFSLRSKRLCEYASKCWSRLFRFLLSEKSRWIGEDFYYTSWLKLLPTTWFRYRFPNEREAYRFSVDRLGGHVTPPHDVDPFGVHGRDAVVSCESKVTVLAYHFWEDEGYDDAFAKVAKAFGETWCHCGKLESVVVVNKVRPCVEKFAAANPQLSIQVEPRLVPGRIFTMSEDCNSRLYTRFSTPYVLIVQNDGWPLRGGLENFTGLWDFIGAPYVRDIWWKRLVANLIGFHPMNGGFSLRSRRCCEEVAKYWNGGYHRMGDCHFSSEDLFVTHFLPKHEPEFRRAMRFPDVRTALAFSYEEIGLPYTGRTKPFGFHRLDSLEMLLRKFGQ